MKLIIGNRAYSSWSMRGWLALKHAGFEFEELVVPLFDEVWEQR
ncbi:MAG TPA: glutathione S-transferase family protein, partial [Sphingomicrobium sp.]